MAGFSFSDIISKLDHSAASASNFVDLADRIANDVNNVAKFVPGVGTETQALVDALNALDAALKDVKSAVGV